MSELQEEEEKLRKIINIVRPTALPELTKPQGEDITPKLENIFKVNPINNSNQSSTISTLSTKIENTEKIKPNTENKVKIVINTKVDDLKKNEGIVI